jgi:hypothetical protein
MKYKQGQPNIVDLRESPKSTKVFHPTYCIDDNGNWERGNFLDENLLENPLWMSSVNNIIQVTDNIALVMFNGGKNILMKGEISL